MLGCSCCHYRQYPEKLTTPRNTTLQILVSRHSVWQKRQVKIDELLFLLIDPDHKIGDIQGAVCTILPVTIKRSVATQ
jgi:hypothetical protein